MVVKGSVGDATDVNKYRGITLSPVTSMLFEYCVMEKFQAEIGMFSCDFCIATVC